MISDDPASLRVFLDHPDALRVRRRLTPVRAVFAAADGTCETLEGPVRFRAGDALLTGGTGEQWPMRRPDFDAAYRQVAARDGTYVKTTATAVARRLDRRLLVPVGWQQDLLQGDAGDWLLRYTDLSFGIVQDDIFRNTYQADAGECRWPPPA